jgi:hypothetical protein
MSSAGSHLFILRLGRSQSIGPARLQQMWKTACGCTAISVSRQPGQQDDPSYLLAAHVAVLEQDAEQRLRRMLEGFGFSFRLMRTG